MPCIKERKKKDIPKSADTFQAYGQHLSVNNFVEKQELRHGSSRCVRSDDGENKKLS